MNEHGETKRTREEGNRGEATGEKLTERYRGRCLFSKRCS